jgi:6-pyruvoyltetrahydropterin/6-carboxytetrahydropterin synthase
MFEIFKEFAFDAAHQLAANVEPGHAYARLHGHSFRVEVHLQGTPGAATGWITDFGEIDRAMRRVQERLDHRYLNEIAGLERPTLERLAKWIFEALAADLPALRRVVIRRGSGGEGCVYERAAS